MHQQVAMVWPSRPPRCRASTLRSRAHAVPRRAPRASRRARRACVCSADRGGTVKECIEDVALPEECANLKKMFFECRRGQLVSVGARCPLFEAACPSGAVVVRVGAAL